MQRLKQQADIKKGINKQLVLGIIATIGAGAIFGIPTIIMSIRSEKAKKQGDLLKSEKLHRTGNILLIIYAVYLVIALVAGGIMLATGNKLGIGIDSGKSKTSKNYQPPNLDQIDISDFSTVPLFIEETPFTLPAPMDVLDVIEYEYDKEQEVEAYGYQTISAVKGESIITITCKNTENKKQKIKDCIIVSLYFSDISQNCNLHGLKIGDNEGEIEKVLGKCNNIQETKLLDGGVWKDFKYALDGYDVFAEIVTTQGKIKSILFKYEYVEKEDSTEKSEEETEPTSESDKKKEGGNIFFN